ncbi:MAG: histidine phosphatase family protein [Deltaproteobacteria bacterium]|nr:histidine phosphatase family protein [Deltaproteobacteria bacterium]
MNPTRIFLIRHGQVVNHHEFRYNGHFDVDITDTGVEQMDAVAGLLSNYPVKAVYSSDLTRAVKGAEIIGRRLGLAPSRLPALRELSLGRWEGLTREEAVSRFPEDSHLSFRNLGFDRIGGGEGLPDLNARVLPAIAGIVEAHAGGSVCILAHGGVNRVVLCDAMGLSVENFFRIEQDYGCVNVIDYFADGCKVVKLLNGGPNQGLNPARIY